MPDRDLTLAPGVTIPASCIEMQVSTPGGPGGQHANRAQTRVELVLDLEACDVIPESMRDRLVSRLGPTVRVSAADTRSQSQNRDLARARLQEQLQQALKPRKRRKPTTPSGGARRRRLRSKRHRSEIKKLRRRPTRRDW